MKDFIEKVIEFNKTAGVTISETPRELSEGEAELAFELISEEFDELLEARDNNDIIEERDAIGDLLYVVIGYAVRRGISDKIVDDFYAIHRSNMSKFDINEGNAILTAKKYKEQNIETYYKKVGDFYVTYRKSDNKILKSKYYNKVQLK